MSRAGAMHQLVVRLLQYCTAHNNVCAIVVCTSRARTSQRLMKGVAPASFHRLTLVAASEPLTSFCVNTGADAIFKTNRRQGLKQEQAHECRPDFGRTLAGAGEYPRTRSSKASEAAVGQIVTCSLCLQGPTDTVWASSKMRSFAPTYDSIVVDLCRRTPSNILSEAANQAQEEALSSRSKRR